MDLEQNYLCRILMANLTPRFAVLCLKCRNAQAKGFKREGITNIACERCGASGESVTTVDLTFANLQAES